MNISWCYDRRRGETENYNPPCFSTSVLLLKIASAIWYLKKKRTISFDYPIRGYSDEKYQLRF